MVSYASVVAPRVRETQAAVSTSLTLKTWVTPALERKVARVSGSSVSAGCSDELTELDDAAGAQLLLLVVERFEFGVDVARFAHAVRSSFYGSGGSQRRRHSGARPQPSAGLKPLAPAPTHEPGCRSVAHAP